MVKYFSKLKQNNKGMSLIEIMVTIAMIIIIAGPLINAFLNAMGVNSSARQIQNGTTVAQDMFERFQALSIEELTDEDSIYYEYMTVDGRVDGTDGIFKFEGIPVEGPNGEDFKVDVTLDPQTYTSGNTSEKFKVNDVNIPGMSSLYGSDSTMLYKQYVSYDDKLKELFNTKLSAATVSGIYLMDNRKRVSKETDIILRRTYNNALDKFEYDITLNMKYTFNNGTETATVTESRYIEDVTYSKTEMHNIYFICPVFDMYTYNPQLHNESYASDRININYIFNDGYDEQKVYFYIAEQSAMNLDPTYASFKQRINPQFVTINNCALSVFRVNNTQDDNVKLYTNIGTTTTATDLTDLTYIDKNTGDDMYSMKVEVNLKGKVVADFESAKTSN